MPKDKPIKVQSIQYKPCKQYNYLFGAIQVTLSNGVSSPVFTARQQDDSNFKTVNITNSAQIRRISARRSNVGRITFMDAKG